MSWKPEIDELKKRAELAEELGGKKSRNYQHSIGKNTARERIDMLLDRNSFREMGKIAGKGEYDEHGNFINSTPSNAIIGKGLINQCKVAVSIDDFTIRGGSSEATIAEKWLYIERYALEMKMPLLRLVDSAGGSVKLLEQMGYTKIPGYPSWPQFQLMSEVPVVGIALGACAGLGAIKVGYAHFSVMVKGTSQVFAAGPPVVKAAMAEDLDKEQLGGWRVQTRDNGAVDNASGVAGILTLADALTKTEKAFSRTVMFSAFTAEETGLLGADYFANNPPVPTKNMVAFLNIDGMNVNDDVDYILQYGEGYLSIEDDLATAASLQDRRVKMDPRPQNGLFFRSDHFALAKQGVPSILFMSLGDTDPSFITNRYHKADDDYLSSWTLGGVKQDLSLIGTLLTHYAQGDVWPYWKRESDFKAKRLQALSGGEATTK